MEYEIEVVAGVLKDVDGRVLLMRRVASANPEVSDVWCHAGGKIEIGETPEEALIREWDEELGQSIKVLPDVIHVKFGTTLSGIQYRVRFYSCQAEPRSWPHLSSSNIAIGWWTKKEALMLPLTPGDRETILKTM